MTRTAHVPAWCVAALCLLLTGCPKESAHRPLDQGPPRRWHYEVTLNDELTRADVEVCFEGAVPRELRAGTDDAAIYLSVARWLRPGSARRLPVRGGKVQLSGYPANGCVGYRVDLARAAGQGFRVAARLGDDLLAAPALWLWRPQRRDPRSEATLTLRLPAGVHASLPWPQREGKYRLQAEDFRFIAYAAFGRMPQQQLQVAGTQVNIDLVGGPLAVGQGALERWLRETVTAVAEVTGGRFPTPRLQVLVTNVGPGKAPVAFGAVGRGGGASVLMLASSSANEEDFRRDWVLPHELSHLYLPYVRREDAWLSEGVSTYYQEVLRVRAGLKAEREAWQTLLEATTEAIARKTGRTIRAESAAMSRTREYRRVYWSGASFALIADARLRQASGGTGGLDQAIRKASWWRAAPRTWRATEVLAALDVASGTRVFSSLAEQCEPLEFPPVMSLLEQLGVHSVDGRVQLDESAPWAAVRRAIMRPRAAPQPP